MTQVEIGQYNTLTVIRKADFGVYLDGGEFGGVLLPQHEYKGDLELGEAIRVFIYLDSNDFIVATTREPLVTVGGFAYLKVSEVNPVGAFVDWGLPKQLLLPYGEQRGTVEEGQKVFVRVYLDNSERIAATAKIEKFLEKPDDLKPSQPVKLDVWRRSDLGYLVVIDQRYMGLLHHKDLFRTVRVGQTLDGFIKQVLPDGKVDVMLEKPGYGKVDPLAEKILNDLKDKDGFSPLGDKSEPEAIYQAFGISKKSYKMAIGGLKKQGLISIDPDGIRLI
jgi:predicted RNA-binding protein (virulence factor B family)